MNISRKNEKLIDLVRFAVRESTKLPRKRSVELSLGRSEGRREGETEEEDVQRKTIVETLETIINGFAKRLLMGVLIDKRSLRNGVQRDCVR